MFGWMYKRNFATYFTPYDLFSASEPGAWYDPSDLSTLFQDSAGTTPVTAVEQPVGRMLDKSGNGNHASQATTTKRGVVSRRVNLLTKTEDFTNVAWTTGKSAGASAASNTALAPNGAMTADTVTFANGTDYLYRAVSGFATTVGGSIVLRYCSKVTGRLITLGGATPAGTDVHSYADIGGGWYEHKTTRTFTVAVTGLIQVLPNGSIVGAGSFEVWGASVTLATDSHLPYQRVNTATDYDADPSKFPTYLRFDGVDDALVTGSIDFTGTDKMTVWAGITKLSDASDGVIVGTASSPIGRFELAAPGSSTAAKYQFASTGTVSAVPFTSSAIYNSPHNGVITGLASISTPLAQLRINGTTVSSYSSTQGAGNYSSGPLNLGATGGGITKFFNGRLYQLIVRGAQTPPTQIEATELYIKQKMRMP